MRTGIAPGYIFSGNPFLLTSNGATDPTRWTPSMTIEVGRQTDGSEEWHGLYGMPAYGLGMSFVSFGNGVAAGRPMEAYAFFSWPFAHVSRHVDVTTDFGMGLSWGWNQTNVNTNASESVLGSNLNARINWGFNLRYALSPRVALYGGIDYTHRSNGGLVQPDQGINVIGPKLSVQYNLAAPALAPRHVDPPLFQPAWEFVVGATGGVKNVIEQSSPRAREDFAAFDVTAATQRQFYQFGKIAAGIDLTYDGSMGAAIGSFDQQRRADAGQRFAIGVYGGYEHIIGRFSVIAQVGDNVVRGFVGANAPRLYSRYGWRYHFNEHMWSTIAIRATGVRNADALEIGAGYRLRRPSFRR